MAEPEKINDPARGKGADRAHLKPLSSDGPLGPGARPGSLPRQETMFQPGETPVDVGPPADDLRQESDSFTLASKANMKRRHWGLLVVFVFLVLVPFVALCSYLWVVAEDQYASTTGFTVRQEEGTNATDLLGGIAQFAGTGGTSDGDVLYEFIQSQKMVERIDARLDLRGHYQQHWDTDKVFSIWPDASIEDLQWFWSRVVRISYDQGAGLIELRVLAFDPAFAQAIAQEIVAESQSMINALSGAARADATRYAEADLAEALARLKTAREALTAFRSRTQIVDPAADIQGRMGVMNNLQQQLAEALIAYDLLRETGNSADPRLGPALKRIEVIRARIQSERTAFAEGAQDVGAIGDDYPSLIAEFERLTVDREYAEETYRAALAALDISRAKAARLSRYLATYIEPTLAESAEYPRRVILASLGAMFLLLSWAVLALVYYSIRDRR